MGFSETFAEYGWFQDYVANLSAITVKDVQRVAQQVLQRSNRTVGWYVPVEAQLHPTGFQVV